MNKDNPFLKTTAGKLVVAIIILLILAVIGVVIYLSASDKDNDKKTTENITTQEPTTEVVPEVTDSQETTEATDAANNTTTTEMTDNATTTETTEASEDYLIQMLLMENNQISSDVNGDGIEELITVSSNWYDDYYGDGIIINVGSRKYEEDAYVNGLTSWLYNDQYNNKYILISLFLDGGEYRTLIYTVDGENINKIYDVWDEYIDECVNGQITTSGYNHCFGTFTTYRNYTLSPEGFVPEEDRFWFYDNMGMENRRGPITTATINVKLSQGDDMVDAQLEPGTRIYPVNTDKTSVMGFVLEDGTYGELYFEIPEGDFYHYIDGVSEDELFDDLFYAG